MNENPACPVCTMTDLLETADGHECITCGHEWAVATEETPYELVVKDANGNLLADGDAVTLVKNLKVKGGTGDLKVGTRITNIRLVEGDHEVDCKIDGQAIMLKAQFLKKA